MTNPITAIIFDMDGLMLDSQRIGLRTWHQVCAEWGYAFKDEYYQAVVGQTVPDIELAYKRIFGPDMPFAEMYEARKGYVETLMQTEGIPHKPGLIELLDWVDATGLPKAVATSTDRTQAIKRLTHANILHRFTISVCGDEVEQGKPAPDIFLAAAKKLQTPPPHCLVLEDATAGVLAAHAAGMTAMMVPDLVQPRAEVAALAHAVVPTLHEAMPLIADLVTS